MIILASGSARRREILETLGAEFKIITADTDESCDESNPETLARLLAERKGLAVYEKIRGCDDGQLPIISADTIVFCDGEIMGKPKDCEDARRMLEKLSGRSHSVTTGICIVLDGKIFSRSITTRVSIAKLSGEDIENYIATRDPLDKAGAYGIQGVFSKHVEKIDGCYFNVVGLPTSALYELAKDSLGIKLF